ncbi:MAG: FAD/NAD(P)-binding protein [Luteolibacter sp.]
MKTKRLAIIGAGASGLIALKNTIAHLPGWEITCFEKGADTTGCWGNPYPGFVSTSTKYTTQFSSFRKWDSTSEPSGRPAKADFFRDGEYGDYLNEFRDHFGLAPYIRLNTPILRIRRVDNCWSLDIGGDSPRTESFDTLILCTGLAAQPKPIESSVPILKISDLPVRDKTIVVIGGGESGADHAHRLAAPSLRNTVYLSLKNGIRVSPRYHPIRGVPSDFLRNRLMLSIHPNIRNAIGQKFVEARIRHQELFEKLFKTHPSGNPKSTDVVEKRKHWDAKLTARAKDKLFNTFHTKSDNFLDDVAEGRIQIIGSPIAGNYHHYSDFDGTTEIDIQPDALVPSIGFTAGVDGISEGAIRVRDFYLGCLHVEHDDLFLVGYARPIIGNIPTISEMQARLVTGIIAGKFERPANMAKYYAAEREQIESDFSKLNTETIHPVEMIPYCDRLAKMMGTFPSFRNVGSLKPWMKIQLSAASTTHYLDEDFSPEKTENETIHSPPLITLLLLAVKAIEPFLRKASQE